MLKPTRCFALILAVCATTLSSCDVEKQMDTMVDNPSFAEPLFTKFMARGEYQIKAMDTLLADSETRQMILEKIVAEPEYASAMVQQLMADPQTRSMLSDLISPPTDTITKP